MPLPGGAREFDVIVLGATGYTGRLTVQHLVKRYGYSTPSAPRVRIAIAGRRKKELEAIAATAVNEWEAEEAPGVIVIADATTRSPELDALCARGAVIATTMGPYAAYGQALVASCVDAATDCCDLTGESTFIKRVIDKHHADAASTGVRIVNCCGYDSIPSDLGTMLCLKAKTREPVTKIDLWVGKTEGGFSGGTVASLFGMMKEKMSVLRAMQDPYYLANGTNVKGPDVGEDNSPTYSKAMKKWGGSFVMAVINERLVRRSASLLGERRGYPASLLYKERMLYGRGLKGWSIALAVSIVRVLLFASLAIPGVGRYYRKKLPKPGEGPTEKQREEGCFTSTIVGHSKSGEEMVRVTCKGQKDPGYGSTAVMLGETAVALSLSRGRSGGNDVLAGGVLTPASSLGQALVDRLNKEGCVTFETTVA